MTKHNTRDVSYLGLKVFSSALLIQQVASAAPAFAHGHRGPHQRGIHRADARMQKADLGAHFGMQQHLEKPAFRPAMAGMHLPLVRQTRVNDFRLDTAGSIDLDLSSQTRSIVIEPDMIRRGSSVSIQVGDTTRVIREGDAVTAAEFVSLNQAQAGRGQTLEVDASGRASGGTFSLGSLTTSKHSFNVDDVLIPQSVQSIDRVTARSQIDISGTLTNFGTISETARGRNGNVGISADNILNQSGALITTVDRTRGGRVDLSLTASGEIDNAGTISSSGDVSLNAANIVNSGSISAVNGSITIDAPSLPVTNATADGSQILTVNNTSGTLSALNDINIRSGSYNGSAHTTVTGGDLLAQRLVLNSGQGQIDVNVDKLTGEVVSFGNAVHVNAQTDNLILGEQKLDGDPTFYNSTGAITINGDITVGETLAIVASGSIVGTVNLKSITARDGSGDGYDISIIAGVDVTGVGGDSSIIPPFTTPATGTVSFTGVSVSSGSVDLTLSDPALTINSNATAGNHSGGNVLIAAYTSGFSNGRVLLPTGSNINVGGNGPGASGSVTIIGSTTLAGLDAVQMGGVAGAVNVTVMSAAPVLTSGASMTFDKFGAITSGNSITGDYTKLAAANIIIGGPISASGNVQIAGGGKVDLAVVTTKTLQVAATNSVTLNGSVTSSDGILIVTSNDIVSSATNFAIDTSTGPINSGFVSLIAGAAFTASSTGATITGASAVGGSVELSNTLSLNTSNSFLNGGNVTVVAFDGTDATSGTVALPSTVITNGSNPGGFNGEVVVIAGETTAGTTAITFGDITTTNSPASAFGSVTLAGATPGINAGNPLVIDSTSVVKSGPVTFGTEQQTDILGDDIIARSHTILIRSGRNVKLGDLDVRALSAITNFGGTVDVLAPGTQALLIGGSTANSINSINVSGDPTSGDAGGVILTSNNGITINVGSLNTTVVDGNGATVNLDASNGIIVLPSNTIAVDGAGNGFGGNLNFKAQDISSFFPTLLSADGSGTGNGGTISLEFTGNVQPVSIDTGTFILNARSGNLSGNGGSVTVLAKNVQLSVEGSAIDVAARGTDGDGGSISLTGGAISVSGGGALQLSANGVGNGNGGTIFVHQVNGGQLVVGDQNGQLQLAAQGGAKSGNGGKITVINNADLLVNGVGLNVAPLSSKANGGELLLQAGESGQGNLLVLGNLNASGNGAGFGGNITLISNSTLDFLLTNKKAVNGVNGALTLTGSFDGVLTVSNLGGGITTSGSVVNIGAFDLSAAGTGSITVGGVLGDAGTIGNGVLTTTGTGNITSKKLITAGSLAFTSGGFIGGKKALKINTNFLTGTALEAINLANSNAGTLFLDFGNLQSNTSNVNLTTAGDIVVNSTVIGTNVKLISTGQNSNITFNTGAGVTADLASGLITLATGKGTGAITFDPAAGSLQALSVDISADKGTIGTAKNSALIDTQNLVVTADGNVFLTNLGANSLNLNSVSTSNNFELSSVGGIFNNAPLKNATSILLESTSASALVALNTSLGGKNTDVVIINGTGGISQTSTKAKVTGNLFVTLTTSGLGDIGDSSPIVVISQDVSVNAGSGTALVNSVGKSTVALNANLGGDITFNSAGPTLVNNSTAGSFVITAAGGRLNVNDSATVHATNGGITLQNIGKGKGSVIELGANSTLESDASIKPGGEILLVMGSTLPPPQTNTTPPPNVSVTGTGSVFFNEGLTATGPTNKINVINTNVIFSAGKFGPSAILLDGGVNIDADPPDSVTAVSVADTQAPQVPTLSKHESKVRNQSLQLTDSGIVRVNSGVNLDLTSHTKNITLGRQLFEGGAASVTITVGGDLKTVSAGSQVTAAEYVAVKQVLSGAGQTVSINSKGVASGGEVDLDALTIGNDVMKATALVVAANVTTHGDFGKHSDFRLNGDLTNYGNLIVDSSVAGIKGGAIRANDINNEKGASILSTVNLTLDASGQLNNFGVIASEQDLTLTAADSVNNSGSISAAGNINLDSQSVNNRGAVRSISGNINLNGAADAALMVNDSKGSLSALNGAINLRDTAYSGTFNSTIYGGDLFSKELNMHSGNGVAVVRVNELTGLVNQTGGEAHVSAATSDLNIGSVCLTGDPTIYNTQGNITISKDLAVSEDLAIIAAGNIISLPGVKISADSQNQGFKMNIIAGAVIIPQSGSDSSDVPPYTKGQVDISGKGTKSGGGIFLGAGTTITTRPTDTSGSGAAIWMAAYAGKGTDSGIIDISGAKIETGGKSTGNNGSLSLLAGAKSGDVIRLGTIDLTGGTGADGGSLIMTTSQPFSSDDLPVTYLADGTRVGSELLSRGRTKGAVNIVFNDSSGGVDVTTKFISAFSGANIIVKGQIATVGKIIFNAANKIEAPPLTNESITADSLEFTSRENIGTQADPLAVTVNKITAFSDRSSIFMDVAGSGSLSLLDVVADEDIVIDAPGKVVTIVNQVNAGNSLTINGFGLINTDKVKTSDTLSLGTLDPTFILNGVGGNGVDTLILNAAGGIGTSGSPFSVAGAKSVTATSSGDIFLFQSTADEIEFNMASSKGDISMEANGSVTVLGANAPAGVVALKLLTVGTLTIDGVVNAENSIDINNVSSGSKSKIVFAKNTTVSTASTGLGEITILLGSKGLPLANPSFKNVDIMETGANVNFFGSGLSGKKPLNTIWAKGAKIDIYNSFKAANLSLGGGVQITADPPVSEGTDTLIRSALIRTQGDNQDTSRTVSLLPAMANDTDVPLIQKNFDDASKQTVVDVLSALNNSRSSKLPIDLISVQPAIVHSLNYETTGGGAGYQRGWISETELDSGEIPAAFNMIGEENALQAVPKRGSILLTPESDTAFETEFGAVNIAANSVALVMSFRDGVAIYNFDDSRKNSVTFTQDGKRISVSPGQSLIVTRDSGSSLADINPAQLIAHRSVTERRLGNGIKAFHTEFSIPSALGVVLPIKSLVQSKHPHAVRTAKHLMKTAAVLMQLQSGGEGFRQHRKPQITAYRN